MTNAVGIAQSGANNVTMRNRIINGGMVIDQRNAGAAITTATFSVDRWSAVNNTTGGAFSLQQSTVVPSTAFTNSIKWTTTTAASALGSTESAYINQWIEGYNCSDFGLGAAGAATVTLSFWVRSSLTGTFSISYKNSAANRGYAATYTINSADTWEFKTITVTMDTTGTWVGGNGAGLQVVFSLGAGSSRSATAGSWQGANVNGATGTTSVINSLNATFYITGVQLEKGTTATPFEQRLYGTELALCQRYCPAYAATSSSEWVTALGWAAGTTNAFCYFPFQVQTRVKPTGITVNSLSNFYGNGVTTNLGSLSSIAVNNPTVNGCTLYLTGTGGTNNTMTGLFTANSSGMFYFTGCEL